MKRYVKSSLYDQQYETLSDNESLFDDLYEEACQGVIDFIENGEAMSYDDVVSEAYAQIQYYCDRAHCKISDNLEDTIYESIMDTLDLQGYINHSSGLLLWDEEQ